MTHDQQRGARAHIAYEIQDNTPQDLVHDIEKLRTHLRVDRPFLVFAGSWGTTLAMLYAQAHPGNVAEMILRGVSHTLLVGRPRTTSTRKTGATRFSPRAWEAFVAELPPGSDRIQERLHRLFEEGGPQEKRKWFSVLFAYE